MFWLAACDRSPALSHFVGGLCHAPTSIAVAVCPQDKSSTGSALKIQALLFLRLFLAASDPAAFAPSAPALAPPIYAAVSERYYKVGCPCRPSLQVRSSYVVLGVQTVLRTDRAAG